MLKDKDHVLLSVREYENLMKIVRSAYWFVNSTGPSACFGESQGEDECQDLCDDVGGLLPELKKVVLAQQ